MAYPAYEDNGGIADGTDYAVAVPYPGTVNENDILLVCVLDADNDSFDVPSGWAKITEDTSNSNASFAWYWKRATGSETGSETFTSVLNASALVAGVMARFSGCVTTGDPYDTGFGHETVNQGTTINIPTLDTADTERLVVAMIAVEDNTGVSQASDYTEAFDVTTTTGGDGEFSFQTQQVATDSTVPADTATTGNDYHATCVIALKPVGTPPVD